MHTTACLCLDLAASLTTFLATNDTSGSLYLLAKLLLLWPVSQPSVLFFPEAKSRGRRFYGVLNILIHQCVVLIGPGVCQHIRTGEWESSSAYLFSNLWDLAWTMHVHGTRLHQSRSIFGNPLGWDAQLELFDRCQVYQYEPFITLSRPEFPL
jgi:hypothetical protein